MLAKLPVEFGPAQIGLWRVDLCRSLLRIAWRVFRVSGTAAFGQSARASPALARARGFSPMERLGSTFSSIGILNIECDKENAFDRLDEETVTALAGLATIAIQNSRECSVLSPGIACIAIMQGLSAEVRSEALTPNRHHVPFGRTASTSINQKTGRRVFLFFRPAISGSS